MTTESTKYTTAEKAVAVALHAFLTKHGQIGPERPCDFYDDAVDIAAAAEGHQQLAAYNAAVEEIDNLVGRARGQQLGVWVDGAVAVRALVSARADALRADLLQLGAE